MYEDVDEYDTWNNDQLLRLLCSMNEKPIPKLRYILCWYHTVWKYYGLLIFFVCSC